jgi:sulfonate transport system permease protein
MKALLWKLWLPVALLALWQFAASYGILDPIFFPSPARILATFSHLASDGTLGQHLRVTLTRLAAGLCLGVGSGLVCAIAAALVPAFSKSIEPLLGALLSIPKLTLLPLFILVMGTGNSPRVV